MATRNRRARVLATLERLTALPGRPRVVLVDDASTDGTAEAVSARFGQVDIVRLERSAGSYARVVGAERLATDLVAFADDDSWWAPDAPARAAALFAAHPHLGLLAARVLVGPHEELDPVCAEMARSPLADAGGPDVPGVPVLGFIACGAIVRRSAFLAAGGFHPAFGIGGEEELLALDLAAGGWLLRYVPEVVAHHHPAPRGPQARHARRRHQLRNELWTAWLRAPAADAAARTARMAARHPGVLPRALRGMPWIARERRPVGRTLARRRAALG
jgi:GT2 family glycosyltransferase